MLHTSFSCYFVIRYTCPSVIYNKNKSILHNWSKRWVIKKYPGYNYIHTITITHFVLCSAEQQCQWQPDGKISVTQSTSSDQQIQENVSSCGHKMVLLFQILFSLSGWCQVPFVTTLRNRIDLWYTIDLIMSDRISHFKWKKLSKRSTWLLEL